MGQSEKAWTEAIREFLADKQVHLESEAIAVGAAVVDDDRAKKEMGSKQSNRPQEDRIAAGKKNVAKQAITGMIRFGKAVNGVDEDGKRTIRWISQESTSVGRVADRVSELEEQVAQLLLKVDALESTVDFLAKKDAGDADSAGEQYLASVGVNSSESSE
jgi:Tfp pilus assembly major pilin PilA